MSFRQRRKCSFRQGCKFRYRYRCIIFGTQVYPYDISISGAPESFAGGIQSRTLGEETLVLKSVTSHSHLRQHTSPPGFAKTPFFFGQVAVLLWLHFCVCVCPLVHPLRSSVPQTVTPTQYHSVWTSNGSPSSRATRLLHCFTQVSDMVFTTRHN